MTKVAVSFNEKFFKSNLSYLQSLQEKINQVIDSYRAIKNVKPIEDFKQIQGLVNDPGDYIFNELTAGKSFEIGGLQVDRAQLKGMVKMPPDFGALEAARQKVLSVMNSKAADADYIMPRAIDKLHMFFTLTPGTDGAAPTLELLDEKIEEMKEANTGYLHSSHAQAVYELATKFIQLVENEKTTEKAKLSVYPQMNTDNTLTAMVRSLFKGFNFADKDGKLQINLEFLHAFDRNGLAAVKKIL